MNTERSRALFSSLNNALRQIKWAIEFYLVRPVFITSIYSLNETFSSFRKVYSICCSFFSLPTWRNSAADMNQKNVSNQFQQQVRQTLCSSKLFSSLFRWQCNWRPITFQPIVISKTRLSSNSAANWIGVSLLASKGDWNNKSLLRRLTAAHYTIKRWVIAERVTRAL